MSVFLRRRLAVHLALLFGALLAAVAATGLLHLDERNQFYDIEANTVLGVWKELRSKGPTRVNGDRAFGYTSWTVEWSFRLERRDQLCAVVGADIELAITTTLPRWTPPSDKSRLAARWERFSTALSEHEQQHRNNALAAGNEIRALFETHPLLPCSDAEASLNREATALRDAHRRWDADFDKQTDHGYRTGVKWL